MENGLGYILFGIGALEADAIHLNDIEPAHYDGPHWKKGDLLLSIRNQSLVLIYRPGTNEVVWHQMGPWTMQHDPDFVGTHQISVFGNDVTSAFLQRTGPRLVGDTNDLYIVDLETNETTTPYSELFENAQIKTVTGGFADVLENGDLFVGDSKGGRLLRGNTRDVLWYYVNILSNGNLTRIGGRYVPNLDQTIYEETSCD